MIRISAFAWVQPFAQGYVRDLRVRWALEEVGLPYEVRRVDRAARASAEYRALQPFAQVPSYEEDGLMLFESGAIVLHIAERSDVLLPAERAARARAVTWLFAALNTIEPPIQEHAANALFERDDAVQAARRPKLLDAIARRLAPLAERLAGQDWLEDRFTCADLMMASVLRVADDTDLVSGNPPLAAYLDRCTTRPGFRKSLADQLADFADQPPPALAS